MREIDILEYFQYIKHLFQTDFTHFYSLKNNKTTSGIAFLESLSF